MSSVCSSSPCCWPIVIQSPPCTPEADPLVQTSCLELGTLHQVLDLEYTKLYLVSMTKLFPLYWTFSGKSNKMYVYLKGTSYIFFQAENRSNINSSKNKSIPDGKTDTSYNKILCVYLWWSSSKKHIKYIYTVPGNFPLFLAAAFSIDSLTQK